MKKCAKYIEECLEKGVDAIKLRQNDSRIECDSRTRAMYESSLKDKEVKGAKRIVKVLHALECAMLEAARTDVHAYFDAIGVVERLLLKHEMKMLARKNKQKCLAKTC